MAWYVIHTFTGHENKVKTSIERRAVALGISHKLHRILVVTEDELTVIHGSGKQIRKRKVYPGYIFIEMDLDDETRYLIRNTPGVTGFVGPDKMPVPLQPHEINTILEQFEGPEQPLKVAWEAGQTIRVVTGPFADFQGTIEEVMVPSERLRVLITLFGRDTPVTLGFGDIEKV